MALYVSLFYFVSALAAATPPPPSEWIVPPRTEAPSPSPATTTTTTIAAAPCGACRRVVSLSPAITETIFALGRGDRVVAVTRYDEEPSAAARLPRVGGMVDPDVESVLAQRPEVVIAAPIPGTRSRLEQIARLGVPVLVLRAESLADLWTATDTLGALFDARAAAAQLRRQMEQDLAQVAVAEAGAAPLRVLVVVGYRPLVAAGPTSFIDSLLGYVRATNVVSRGDAFVTLDLEAVVASRPDVIVDATMGEQAVAGFWERVLGFFPSPPRLVRVSDEALLRPGPRLTRGVRTLAQALRSRS